MMQCIPQCSYEHTYHHVSCAWVYRCVLDLYTCMVEPALRVTSLKS